MTNNIVCLIGVFSKWITRHKGHLNTDLNRVILVLSCIENRARLDKILLGLIINTFPFKQVTINGTVQLREQA